MTCIDIHPVIKIICFLIFSTFLSLGGAAEFGIALFLFLLSFFVGGRKVLKGGGILLLRMKWFFLSILNVYLSFTPGDQLWDSFVWAPSIEGVAQGAYRVGVLVLVILAAKMLMNTMSQNALIGALYWLLAPTRYLGEFRVVFIVRLVLTIESVENVQLILHEERERISLLKTSVIEKWGVYFSNVFQALFTSMKADSQLKELQLLDAPSLLQWCVPIVLFGLFFYVP